MYKHILIATDGSELASRGVAHGLKLARTLGAAVTIVTVTETWSAMQMAEEARGSPRNPVEEFERMASQAAARILQRAAEMARAEGVAAETVHVPDRHPADGIIDTAVQRNCDLIVMASHGRRGIQRVMLGSQASEVLTRSKVPALIVR